MVWLAGFVIAILAPVLFLAAIYGADASPTPRVRLRRTMYLCAVTAFLAALASATLVMKLRPGAMDEPHSAVAAAWQLLPLLALTEELSRFVVLLGYSLRPRERRSARDGIFYGLTAGLTFALLENVMSYQGPAGGGDASGWLRFLLATPLHTLLGGLMGYLIVRAREASGAVAGRLLLALLLPAAIHVAYDAPVLFAARMGAENMTLQIALSAIAVSAAVLLLLAWTVWRLFRASAVQRP